MSTVAPPTTLRVLAWDHPRATRPLAACAAAWERATGRSVEIATRSLAAFGDEVPTALAADIVLIDHPHVGAAAAAGAILPLDGLVDRQALAAIEAASLGGSQRAYRHDGRTWAVAVDAACQALACRPGRGAPATWPEVVARAAAHRGTVALPLHPAHAISALLSLLAAYGVAPGGEELAPPDRLVTAIELLGRVAARGPRAAFDWEPPEALAAVAEGSLELVPLVYTYCGYGVAWHDAPAALPGGAPGSILGGVGAAVLAGCPDPAGAAAFAAFVADPTTQRDLVAAAGGQPATREAWSAPGSDPGLAGLGETFAHAAVRPRAAWWPACQDDLGGRLRDALAGGTPAVALAEALRAAYRRHRRAGG